MVLGSHAQTRAMYSTPPWPSLAASTAAYRRRSFSDNHPKKRCIFSSISAEYTSMLDSLSQNLCCRKDTTAQAYREVILDHILSLGGTQPSQIEQDALRTALDYGTLCIAASGNSFSQPVMYPGAYPEAVAISAVGLVGVYPPGSMEAHSLPTLPTQLDRIGPYGLFVADFSN